MAGQKGRAGLGRKQPQTSRTAPDDAAVSGR